MKFKTILTLLLLPLLTGCNLLNESNNSNNNQNDNSNNSSDNNNGSDNTDTGDNNNDNNDNNDDNPISNSNPDKNHLDDVIDPDLSRGDIVFDNLFTYGNKISITLEFTNNALLKLQEYGHTYGNNDNYLKNEMYHPCNMTLKINDDISTYYEVGARMRGNTSRNYNFIRNDGYFNEGENFHFKLNFSKTFDDSNQNDYYIKPWTNNAKKVNREDRKLGKMKKLDFKWNRNEDYTFTKEMYILDAFRNEGILAQHCNLVEVTIKSEVDSRTLTYQMFESIDKQLIKKIYPNDYSGDLYKCLYQNSMADLTNYNNLGVERTGFRPTYNLKTNEDTSDMSVIKTFIDNVKLNYKDNGLTGEQYYDNISKYLDVDNFLKYSALCWIFGLPDDLRNNANNYYLYFNKDNKALFIPYDNDRCLGIKKYWDKDLKNQNYDDPYAYGYNDFNKCPLILRLVTGGSNNSHPVHQLSKDRYYNYCFEFANEYLNVSKFESFTKQFEGISPNTNINYSNNENETFATYANTKLATLN